MNTTTTVPVLTLPHLGIELSAGEQHAITIRSQNPKTPDTTYFLRVGLTRNGTLTLDCGCPARGGCKHLLQTTLLIQADEPVDIVTTLSGLVHLPTATVWAQDHPAPPVPDDPFEGLY